MNLQQIRKDTPGVDHVIHLNNAGAALPVQTQIDVITKYIQEEARIGGYLQQRNCQSQIDLFYDRAAQLINASADEIAITGNASDGFNHILYAIPFQPGDVILTSKIEYGNNFVNYINLKNKYGIEIKMIHNLPNGDFDLEALEATITERVRLIAVTHIPTSSGVVTPVEAIGKIARKYDILYLVDACQSIGHLPFDVDKVGCHFASVTARKYLRGPRGLGFLYVHRSTWELLQPKSLDTTTAHWRLDETVDIDRSARMFEHWEKSYALVLGFSDALRYLLELGSDATWSRIKTLADYTREQLKAVPGISLHDPGTQKCGIVTFNKKGIAPTTINSVLTAQNINTSVTLPFSSLTDLHHRGLPNGAVRASVHYYNTKKEIDKLIQALDSI